MSRQVKNSVGRTIVEVHNLEMPYECKCRRFYHVENHRVHWTGMMEREKHRDGEKQLMIQSIQYHIICQHLCCGMYVACITANEMPSLVFINNVAADRSSRMNSEACRNKVSASIQPNASNWSDTASQCNSKPGNRQMQHFCVVHGFRESLTVNNTFF